MYITISKYGNEEWVLNIVGMPTNDIHRLRWPISPAAKSQDNGEKMMISLVNSQVNMHDSYNYHHRGNGWSAKL